MATFFTGMSAATTRSRPQPGLSTLVANRCDAAQPSVNSGSILSYRNAYRVLQSCSGIQLEFVNRRMLLSTGEAAHPNEILLKAALEIPDGTIIPAYFAGVREPTVGAGVRVRTDIIPVPLNAGDTIYVRSRPQPVIASSPMVIAGGANYGTVLGGGQVAGDQVDGASTLFVGNAVAFGPSAIIGFPLRPTNVVGIVIGDSIAYGSGDVMTTDGDYGFLARTLSALRVPHFKYASPGLAMPDLLGSTAAELSTKTAYIREYAALYRPNAAFMCMGNNDIHNAGVDLATCQARITRWFNFFSGLGMRIICTTISPRTTSTDAWTTLGNQTKSSGAINTKRRDFNAWLQTLPHPAIAEVWDLAAIVQDPADPDLWRVDGGASTNDGTHPSSLRHITASTAFALNTRWRTAFAS